MIKSAYSFADTAARIAVLRAFMSHDIVTSTLGDCLGEKSIQRSGGPRKVSSYQLRQRSGSCVSARPLMS
jgi:hypothetical protein